MVGARRLAARAFFYPTVLYKRWANPAGDYNLVDDHLILGFLPAMMHAKELVEKYRVRSVVSVVQSHELLLSLNRRQWQKLDVQQLQVDSEDFALGPTVEQMTGAVAFIRQQMRDRCQRRPAADLNPPTTAADLLDATVYVHCKAGRTRSAMVACAYLMDRYGLQPWVAVEYLRQRRPKIVLTDKHLQRLASFYETAVLPGQFSTTA